MARKAGTSRRKYVRWNDPMLRQLAVMRQAGIRSIVAFRLMSDAHPEILDRRDPKAWDRFRQVFYKRFPGPDFEGDYRRAVYYLSPEGREERAERTGISNRKSHMKWTPKMLAQLRNMRKKGRRASEAIKRMSALYPDVSPSTAGKVYQIFLESPNPDDTYRREVAKRTPKQRSKNAKRGWAAHRKKVRRRKA